MSSINTSIYSTAQFLSSLNKQVSAIGDNVAHALDPNYNRRDLTIGSTGYGDAVDLTISRSGSNGERNAVLDSNAQVANATARAQVLQSIGTITGAANGTSNLQNTINDLSTAISTFDVNPGSSAAEGAVIGAADRFATNVRHQFADIRKAEARTQGDLAQGVSDLNTALTNLAGLNAQAVRETAQGGLQPSTADARDKALKDLSKLVPVTITDNPDGSQNITTKSGIALLGKTASQFSFDSSSNNIIAQGAAIPAGYGAAGSLNAGFAGGKLGALVNTLDPATTSTDPGTGTFAKLRSQLASFVDNFANTSTSVNPSSGALENAYAAVATSRPTDLAGGAAPGQGVFTTTTSAGRLDEESFAVNPALLSGTATLQQGSTAALVQVFSAPNASIGVAGAPIGGLAAPNRTPAGLAGDITSFWASAQSAANGQNQAANASGDQVNNNYSARNGVDLDTELVNLKQAENLYKAGAKLLDAQGKLFQTLLDIK
jgi:flagellar hook-associated protein 1 FlgK